jgi:hypothetical protein
MKFPFTNIFKSQSKQIPGEVKKQLGKLFSKAKNIDWEAKNDNYEAIFYLNDIDHKYSSRLQFYLRVGDDLLMFDPDKDKLEKIKEDKRCWKMECRLEDFSTDFADNVLPYCISLFRKIYKDVFEDNIYRPDYMTKSQILEFDCEQLVQNIILLAQPIKVFSLSPKAIQVLTVKKSSTSFGSTFLILSAISSYESIIK